jgi:hypothetical protein
MHLWSNTYGQTPFSPNLNLRAQLFELKFCNNRFPLEATTRKLDKKKKKTPPPPTIHPTRMASLPPMTTTTGICGSIHTPTTKNLTYLKIPTQNTHKLMDTLS